MRSLVDIVRGGCVYSGTPGAALLRS